MMSHPRFLYLHPPKTGGWTVRRILAAAGLGEVSPHYNQHSALHELEDFLKTDRFTFATVREPCDWYRSYFHYNVRTTGTVSDCIKPLLKGEPFKLKSALFRFLFPHVSMPSRMKLLGVERSFEPGLLRHHQIGPYTWMLLNLLGRKPPNEHRLHVEIDRLIDTAQLRDGLQTVMTELDIDIAGALEQVADDNRNVNLVDQGHVLLPYERPLHEDFDDDMVAWVYQADRLVVDWMGYTGPGSSARTSMVTP